MAKRGTQASVDLRVAFVVEQLLKGTARAELLRMAAVKRWKVSERAVDDYIAKANEAISALAFKDQATQFGKADARYNRIFKMAISGKKQSPDVALAAQNALTKLHGLAAPTKVAHSADKGLIDMLGDVLNDPDGGNQTGPV